jgi:hypothetical protein
MALYRPSMLVHGTLPPRTWHFAALFLAKSWHFTVPTDSSFQIVFPIGCAPGLWKTPRTKRYSTPNGVQVKHGDCSVGPKTPPTYAHASDQDRFAPGKAGGLRPALTAAPLRASPSYANRASRRLSNERQRSRSTNNPILKQQPFK